jgi:hypothetical protein
MTTPLTPLVPVVPPGVRAGRLASYGLDLLFVAAPWAAAAGMAAAPAGGNWQSGLASFVGVVVFCAAASLAMVIVQFASFIRRGRTLGMAVLGLIASGGKRWPSLLLDPMIAILSLAFAYPLAFLLTGMDVVSDAVSTAALPFIPLVALTANLALVFLPARRTLTDLVSGVVVVSDGPPAWSSGPQGGSLAVDLLVAASCGAPILLVVGGSQLLTAALGSALILALLGVLELALWVRTGATLGMRVYGVSCRPRT